MKPDYSPALRLILCWLMTGGALLAPGCAKREPAAAGPVATKPAEQRFPLTGEIVKVDAGRQTLIVAHDEIKGFMMAMTMEFKAAPGDLAIARPGQHIRAELVKWEKVIRSAGIQPPNWWRSPGSCAGAARGLATTCRTWAAWCR